MNSNSTPNYKALCAELINHLQVRVSNEDRVISTVGYYSQSQQLLDRARAELAKPDPVAPTDEELLEAASNALGYFRIRVDCKELEANGEELIAYARAVLARWGTPANTSEGD